MVDYPQYRRRARARTQRLPKMVSGRSSGTEEEQVDADPYQVYAALKRRLRLATMPEIIDITGEDESTAHSDRTRAPQVVRRSDEALADVEGSGGTEGVVLPLNMVGGGVTDVAYTVAVQVGGGPSGAQTNPQTVNLQVDTGSSDLWVASTDCNTDPCKASKGHLYNVPASSSAVPTNTVFNIQYLQGVVSGPVYWDSVELGGYSIANQALAAADSVDSEPLDPLFNGILGLALPLNSRIAQQITPGTSNAPDGAAFSANLYSITPESSAPPARFMSLVLRRPGSTALLSQLGVGRHPKSVIPSGSGKEADIHYFPLISERSGTLFWKAAVRDITVWVDGKALPIALPVGPATVNGQVYPSAVLDTGVPLILTMSKIANGIYGALGIGPGTDGTYYVPCDKPLNMTITLDDRPPTPLHPLDLTGQPPSTSTQASSCIGLIQAADAALQAGKVGDMILGVPFMRNIYSVLAYDVPDKDGKFGTSTTVDSGSAIKPRLGTLALTNPTVALDEFQRVRVLNQPLAPGVSDDGGSSKSSQDTSGGSKHISVGIGVLIGLLSLFALCFMMFACVRWGFGRNRRRQAGGNDVIAGGGVYDAKDRAAYQLANRQSMDFGIAGSGVPTEDSLRTLKFEEYMRKKMATEDSECTMSTTRTHVGDADEVGRKTSGEISDSEGTPTMPPKLVHARVTSNDEQSASLLLHTRSPSGLASPPAHVTEFGGIAGVGSGRGSTYRANEDDDRYPGLGLAKIPSNSTSAPVHDDLFEQPVADVSTALNSTASSVARPRPARAPTGPRTSFNSQRLSS